MLFRADPLLVSHFLLMELRMGDKGLILLVNDSVFTLLVINVLILLVCEANHMLFFVKICCLVQSIQKFLVLAVLTLLLTHILRIFAIFLIQTLLRLEMFVLAFKVSFHLQVNDFRVIDTDRALHCFLPHNFID